MSEPDNTDTSTQTAEATQTNGTGGTEAQWYSTLPEGLRDNPNIMKYGSIEDLAQGHINATQLIGRDKIPMPKTDAEFREVYAKLGMPKDFNEYQLPTDDYGIDPSVYSPEEAAADKTWWKEQAHALGLSNGQAAKAFTAFMERQSSGSKAHQAGVDGEVMRAEAALRAEWGERYEGNITIASRAMNKLFGGKAAASITASGLGRNPDFIRGLVKYGATALEDLGIDKHGSAVRSPNELSEDIANLQANPAYWDAAHPEHESTVAKAQALFKRLHQERT